MTTKALVPTALLASCCLAIAASGVQAQSFPTKPLKLVVPYAPGGISDYAGRLTGSVLGKALGQSVVVENRPGGGGIIGTDSVVRSAPDGYTIVQMDPALVTNPSLQPSVPYDIFTQLTTISMTVSSPLVLVVTPHLPVKTVVEFVAYGKANPGKLNFSSAGIGTTPHLAGELLRQAAGVDSVHVPYKSVGPSFPDMMNNKIQFSFSSIAGALPFTKDNRLRALATTGTKRSAIYPDLPTMTEAGFTGMEVDLWLGIFGPAGMPKDVVDKLNQAMNEGLKSAEMKEGLEKIGAEPRGTTSAEGATFIKAEFEKWKKVIVTGKIKPE